MALPQFQDDNRPFQQMQNTWASQLNPLLANPLNSINIIKGVKLINGTITFNHKLGRMMQGWFITDIDTAATIYRSAALNDKTLTLTSNASALVNVGVF